MATSVMPAAVARSSPVAFGTSAAYRTPGFRRIPRHTASVSAICGTHFGLTNAPTSTTGGACVGKGS
jgi:hypothetical protein